MRKELEQIAIIDRYLDGILSIDEKLKVETLIEKDLAFSAQVDNQRLIRKAVQRAAIRQEIKKAKGGGKSGYLLGGLVILLLGGLLGWMLFATLNQTASKSIGGSTPLTSKTESIQEDEPQIVEDSVIITAKLNSSSTQKNTVQSPVVTEELIDFKGLKTWIQPEIQEFVFDAAAGGILEGKYGMVISVPANAFVKQNGAFVNGKVRFELVEALDLEKMVMYNLYTTSGQNKLRTGGMFYLKAYAGDQELQMASKKELIISVPTNELDNEMQLFTGKVENGKVDWQNPEPMKKYLIPIPQNELNFLPKDYETEFNQKCQSLTGKQFSKFLADSVYYTLDRKVERILDDFEFSDPLIRERRRKSFKRNRAQTDSVAMEEASISEKIDYTCGVNATSIETILNSEFAKTFLATKEFEERLKYIHESEIGEQILQLFIKGLNDDLWKVDQKVSQLIDERLKNQFTQFSAEKLTNTKMSESHQRNWEQYFKGQTFLAAKKQKELLKLYKKGNEQKVAQAKRDYLKSVEAYGRLFQRQKDSYKKASAFSPLTSQTINYTFSWSSFGWANIDAYSKTIGKDPRRVKVTYKPTEGVQKICQYLNSIQTLTPLNVHNGVALAVFPENDSRMNETYAMSISKDGSMYYWDFKVYNPYKTDQIDLIPKATNISEIRSTLRRYGIKQKVLVYLKEQEKHLAEVERRRIEAERIREAMNARLNDIRDKMIIRNTLKQKAYGCDGIKEVSEELIKLNVE